MSDLRGVTQAHLSGRGPAGLAQHWELVTTSTSVTLGRSADSDVQIDDPRVSRAHARLEYAGGQWTLVDDGLSANGTFVNGRRVSGRVRLHDRDVIRLGTTVLTFCTPAAALDEQTVAEAGRPAIATLTQPQRRVLVALCRTDHGYLSPASNQQMADELSLSVDAVKTHLRVLFHKFGIEHLPQNQKRSRLAQLAADLGLVPAVSPD